MGVPTKSDVEFILRTARKLRVRLLRNSDAIARVMPEFARTFLPALKACRDFAVCTAPSDAAFAFDKKTGVMLLNAAHIGAILARVELVRASGKSSMSLEERDIKQLRREAVEIFILHEFRHFAQGISRFADVQAVKATEGPAFLAKLDLTADIDAARVWAWLNTLEEGSVSPSRFIFHFFDALAFICASCIPAFGAPMNKPAKVARALSLHLMLARLALARERFAPAEPRTGFLLDTPIMVTFSDDWSKITLIAFAPEVEVKVSEHPCNQNWVARFVARIQAGEFFDAYALAKPLAKKLLIEALISDVSRLSPASPRRLWVRRFQYAIAKKKPGRKTRQ